jgi:hypothetical protein
MMKANFLRFLGITTLSLIVVAQVVAPTAPTVPVRDNSRERPVAVEPTPTFTPTPENRGDCGGVTCG